MVLLVKKVWNLGHCVRNVTRLRWLAVVLLCHNLNALAELAWAIGTSGCATNYKVAVRFKEMPSLFKESQHLVKLGTIYCNCFMCIYNFKFSKETLLKAEKLGREATGVTAMIILNENETADLDKGRN